DQMQQEVSMLRGLLEEQEYRLKKLEQDQLDRYQDIDRRLSALSAGSPAPSGDSGSASPGLAPVTPSTQNQTSNTPPAEADLRSDAAGSIHAAWPARRAGVSPQEVGTGSA